MATRIDIEIAEPISLILSTVPTISIGTAQAGPQGLEGPTGPTGVAGQTVIISLTEPTGSTGALWFKPE